MDSLVLHPTDMSQWLAIVNEAQLMRAVQLDEALESYLVFLLMRYTAQPGLASSVLAMDFLQSQQEIGQARQDGLRDVGDKSLLFSGFFPELAQKRQVTLNYFIDMGKAAYGSLSCHTQQSIAELFASLCEEFLILKDILQAMREMPHQAKLLSFAELEEQQIVVNFSECCNKLPS